MLVLEENSVTVSIFVHSVLLSKKSKKTGKIGTNKKKETQKDGEEEGQNKEKKNNVKKSDFLERGGISKKGQ